MCNCCHFEMLPLYFFVPRAISMIDTVSWLRSIPRCSAPKWSSTTRWRGVPAHVTPPRHDIEIEHAISISPFFLSAHWNPHQFGGHGWSAGAHSRNGHQQRVSPFNILKCKFSFVDSLRILCVRLLSRNEPLKFFPRQLPAHRGVVWLHGCGVEVGWDR